MTNCKNCNNVFDGKFCNLCGQKANVTRLDWHFIIHNIEHTMFHIEQGILFTIRQLFTRPGPAIKEYIEGKRIKYTPPLSYLVICFFAYYFFSKIFNTDGDLVYSSKQLEIINDFLTHYYDKLMLIFVIPLSVVFTNLLFPANPYNFFELFAFHCYMRGQYLIMEMAVILLDWTLVHFNIFLHPTTLIVITFSINISYLWWSLDRFFKEKNKWRSLLKAITLVAMVAGSAFLIGTAFSFIMSQSGIN